MTFAPLRRRVVFRAVDADGADVVMVWVCDSRGAETGAGGARSSGPSSMGNEPVGKRGIVVDLGRAIGAAVVTVAEEAVVDVSGIVLEKPVCGEEMSEMAPPIWVWIALSPP